MTEQANRRKPEKVLLFYNPKAGSGLFKNNLDKIIARFQTIKQIVVPIRAGDDIALDEFLETVQDDNYVKIVVSGGDGTVNRVVNAMVRTGCELPLAILPAGTANGFAHAFNIPPADIDKMLDIAVGDNYATADVGLCNGSYFVNSVAIGAVIDASQKTTTVTKYALGIFAYYIKALSELHNLRALDVTITTPDRVMRENIFFMVVLNGKSAAGLRRLGTHSDISDGLLDVIIFKEMKVSEVPVMALGVIQGKHIDNENVIYFQTPRLKIESCMPLGTDIDGELGHPLPLEIESVPGRLTVNVRPASEPEEIGLSRRIPGLPGQEKKPWFGLKPRMNMKD